VPITAHDSRQIADVTRALPSELALLAGVLRADPVDLQNALTAAHEELVRYADPTNDHRTIDFEGFIQPYAEFGPCASQVRKALDADRGNMVGELMRAYAHPGVLAGLSLAWFTFGRGKDINPSGSPFQLHTILRAIGNYDSDEADAAIAHAIAMARLSLASPHPFDGSVDAPDLTKEVLRHVSTDASQSVIGAMLDAALEDRSLVTTTADAFGIMSAGITHAMLIGAAVMFETLKGGAR
jgi:hypothetical protein